MLKVKTKEIQWEIGDSQILIEWAIYQLSVKNVLVIWISLDTVCFLPVHALPHLWPIRHNELESTSFKMAHVTHNELESTSFKMAHVCLIKTRRVNTSLIPLERTRALASMEN